MREQWKRRLETQMCLGPPGMFLFIYSTNN
jgi:hypothetical protein